MGGVTGSGERAISRLRINAPLVVNCNEARAVSGSPLMAWVRPPSVLHPHEAAAFFASPISVVRKYEKRQGIMQYRKKGGVRPPVRSPTTSIRLSIELRTRIDEWAAQRPDRPTRTEAIRRLIEVGLMACPVTAQRKGS